MMCCVNAKWASVLNVAAVYFILCALCLIIGRDTRKNDSNIKLNTSTFVYHEIQRFCLAHFILF